jgi:hypothetical protein
LPNLQSGAQPDGLRYALTNSRSKTTCTLALPIRGYVTDVGTTLTGLVGRTGPCTQNHANYTNASGCEDLFKVYLTRHPSNTMKSIRLTDLSVLVEQELQSIRSAVRCMCSSIASM